MHAFYEKITILTTVTEKSHAICLEFGGRNNKNLKTTGVSCTDSPFLDATDSSSFQYDKYAAHLSKTVLSEIKSLQSTEGAHKIDRDINGSAQLCKINIQYFPLHCRPLSVKKKYVVQAIRKEMTKTTLPNSIKCRLNYSNYVAHSAKYGFQHFHTYF